MNFNRRFTHNVNGTSIEFDATYNPQTHDFRIIDSGCEDAYDLSFDMQTRIWSIKEGSSPSLSADELATLVQQNFGMFV
ncbi:MAG: hypothetical protein ACTJHT_15245 [Sphingobacterium sp.]|uniref:hypothetical protein n=1 Tax=Sphingobacterium sp. JB170 TaxID=1434842 RepID=UPI00097EF124|nr:hypothetical protein [Sphingobacterium sp. JB170]SJN48342.1 hypothetical protein FM107_17000 [Sphingobacterium sp. JB170]